MKNQFKKILSVFLLLGLVLNLNAQSKGLRSVRDSNRVEKTRKYHGIKEDILIEKLRISKEKEEDFKNIFRKYEEELKSIIGESRNEYRSIDKKEKLSDKEIKDRIYTRFGVYQKLLDHRKAYTDKFLKVLTPEQLEKMFEMERQMGRRAMERKYQMNRSK